jgi:PAS domain S-box-containing protein
MEETDRGVAERTAKAITDLVGDGCVVRIADRAGATLPVAAVEHRDSWRRDQLAALVDVPGPPLATGWPGQALTKNLAFRVEHEQATDAVDCGVADAGSVYAAIVAPLRCEGQAIGTIVALRDSADVPYSLREQQLVEELTLEGMEGIEPFPGTVPEANRLLEHSAAGVWATDLDGVTTYINEAVCALVRVPASELLGVTMSEYLDEEPQLIHARLSPMVERQDHRLLRPDGTEVWVSMTSTPLCDARGRRTGTVSTLAEISDRKRLEVELRLRAAANEAVAELAERALAGDDVESLMQMAAASAADLLGAEYAAVAEVGPGRTDVVPRVVVGWEPSLVGRRIAIPENSATELCLDDDEPFVIGDYEAVGAIRRGMLARRVKARSAACVAIAGGAGVLAVTSPRAQAFNSCDVSFLRSLAAVLGSRWTVSPAPLAAVPA